MIQNPAIQGGGDACNVDFSGWYNGGLYYIHEGQPQVHDAKAGLPPMQTIDANTLAFVDAGANLPTQTVYPTCTVSGDLKIYDYFTAADQHYYVIHVFGDGKINCAP